jgi:hypothetical protein
MVLHSSSHTAEAASGLNTVVVVKRRRDQDADRLLDRVRDRLTLRPRDRLAVQSVEDDAPSLVAMIPLL